MCAPQNIPEVFRNLVLSYTLWDIFYSIETVRHHYKVIRESGEQISEKVDSFSKVIVSCVTRVRREGRPVSRELAHMLLNAGPSMGKPERGRAPLDATPAVKLPDGWEGGRLTYVAGARRAARRIGYSPQSESQPAD